jgi:cobalamin synthase
VGHFYFGDHDKRWVTITSALTACGCILPPLLARAAAPVLFAHTPYIRARGIGADLAQYQSRPGGRWVAALTALAVILGCGRDGLVAITTAVAVYLLMRRAFVRRLGGITGDCAGAIIEVIEVFSLVAVSGSGYQVLKCRYSFSSVSAAVRGRLTWTRAYTCSR